MQILNRVQKLVIVVTILLSLLTLGVLLWLAYKKGEVLSETVTITSEVPHFVQLSIKPEARIPPVGNDTVPVIIEIRAPGSLLPLVTFTATADSSGDIDLGSISTTSLPEGNYDIAVKALSHLRKVYTNQSFSGPALRNISLISPELPAGDVNPTADNLVNSLDIAYLTLQVYGSDQRADLTNDGIVNSLDYAALLKNLNKYGEN